VRVVAVQPLQNVRQDSIPFAQRLAIREAQHLIAAAIHFLRPNAVGYQGFRLEVLAAIQFDNEHRFNTSEVREVRTDRTLATELVAIKLAVAKCRPQASLGVGGVLAQLTRPHPNPLPLAGEGTDRG
jgi:hypothetical protein